MPSVSLVPSVIDQYVQTKLEKGGVASPFSVSPVPNLHISQFGIIQKKYQSGKWQVILDLSSPASHGINDGTP